MVLLGFVWVICHDLGMSRRDELIDAVGGLDSDPVAGLGAVRRLQVLVDEEALFQVRRARGAGVSWGRIGEEMGVTAQAVHRKFALMV